MNIPEIIQPFTLPIKKLFFSKRIQEYCKLKYTSHKNGCPNYGQRDHCPPKVGLIDSYIDINRPMYLVIEEFDLAGHMLKMKTKHPHWTERQCRNVLYWQKIQRKKLKQKVELVMKVLRLDTVSFVPEGMGVQMYRTCLCSGLKLERIKGLKLHRQIAIVGYRL